MTMIESDSKIVMIYMLSQKKGLHNWGF